MEIDLKPLVRNKLINLIQQQKQLDLQIQETISFVLEANEVDVNAISNVNYNDDLSKLIIEDKPSAEK